MSKLRRASIISTVVAVFVTLFSSSALAAPAPPAQQVWGCGCLCGEVVFAPGTKPDPGTVVDVDLLLYEVTDEFVPHVADWKIANWNTSYDVSFGLFYDSSRIRPDREYAMSAVVRDSNGGFVYISKEPLKVITFGNPTSNITIQLERAPEPIP